MKEILLVGAALNFLCAAKLLSEVATSMPTASHLPDQFLQFKLFTAGTAVVFAILYVYLYFHTTLAIPFLVFGAALKSWAFLLSTFLYVGHRLSRRSFLEFGLSNGIVAAMFWYYIAAIA